MPVQRCSLDGKPGFKWGDAGKCYTYTAGDPAGAMAARGRAAAQGAAARAGGYREAVAPVKLPAAVVSALAKGIELHKAGHSGDGLRRATVAMAVSGVRDKAWPAQKIITAAAWFARHKFDRTRMTTPSAWDDPPRYSPAYVAWLLWGSDSDNEGQRWITKKAKEIKAQQDADENQGARTPAPPEDRIKNGRNKGRAGGKATAKIDLSPATNKGLSNLVKQHNDKHGGAASKRASLRMLQKVWLRGAGAFSVSHRPGMTRSQWAFGRVRAFLYLLANGKPKRAAYTTDNDLLPNGHPRKARKAREDASMGCPIATQNLEVNTANRDKAIKASFIQYGPLNIENPGAFWDDIAKFWKTTPEAAKESNCASCVAFDISPRMDDCMPGAVSGDGRLGYCWMHHFKCHSLRTCRTWAYGGPININDISYQWQAKAAGKQEQKMKMMDGYGRLLAGMRYEMGRMAMEAHCDEAVSTMIKEMLADVDESHCFGESAHCRQALHKLMMMVSAMLHKYMDKPDMMAPVDAMLTKYENEAFGMQPLDDYYHDDESTNEAVENPTADQRSQLPAAAFEPAAFFGSNDGDFAKDGSFLRSKSKLPHHVNTVENGIDNDTVDIPRLRNALARFGQTDFSGFPPNTKMETRAHLERHADAILYAAETGQCATCKESEVAELRSSLALFRAGKFAELARSIRT